MPSALATTRRPGRQTALHGRRGNAMDIDKLREFIHLTETKNYHAAASRSYVSQSTLSKHIASMERELGCQLLVRSKQDIALTPFGEALLAKASAVVDAYDECLTAIRQIKDGQRSRLTIGYLYEASRSILDMLFNAFRTSFEECRVEFRRLPGEVLRRKLNDDDLDCVIDMDIGYEDGTVYRKHPIYSDRYAIVVGKTHPLAQRDAITLADLDRETLIIPSESVCEPHFRKIQAAINADSEGRVRTRGALSDPTELPLYVSNGFGIGLVAGHVFESMKHTGLVLVPVEDSRLDFNVSIIWKKANETQPLLSFVDMVSRIERDPSFQRLLPASAAVASRRSDVRRPHRA